MDSTRTRTLLLCLPIAALTCAFDHAVALAESASTPTSHVVGGTDVPAGKWRATAGIVFINGGGAQVLCTGVLIAPTVVMTAGHCVSPDLQQVLLDSNSLGADAVGQAEIIDVVRVVEYPNWQFSYDIAILQLAQPSRIEPMVLSHGCVRDRFIADNAPVTIVGYGAVDPNGTQYINELQEVDTIITDHDCSDLNHGCQTNVQPDGELGAGGMGVDSCFGDSGGPLYLRTESGDFVVGLTSRGYADNSLPCSQGGIYVRLDSQTVRDWIQAEAGITLPESNCGLPPVVQPREIEVEAGSTATVTFDIDDPDPGSVHTFARDVDPVNGLIDITPNGEVEYTPNADYEGPDTFSVAISDNDTPRHTATALVAVTVVPAGCCQTGGTPTSSFWLLLGVVFFLRPRSRRARAG